MLIRPPITKFDHEVNSVDEIRSLVNSGAAAG
jgi:hypothetical protein